MTFHLKSRGTERRAAANGGRSSVRPLTAEAAIDERRLVPQGDRHSVGTPSAPAVETVRASPDRTEHGHPPHYYRRLLALADTVAVILGTTVALTMWIIVTNPSGPTIRHHVVLLLLALPIWLGSIVGRKLLIARAVRRPAEELQRIWSACTVAVALTVIVAFFAGFETTSRGLILALYVCVGLTLTTERVIARSVFRRLRLSGQLVRRVAVIGTDSDAIRIMHKLQTNRSDGYEVVGYIGDHDIGMRADRPWLGPLDAASELLHDHDCSGAVLSVTSIDPDSMNRLVRQLTDERLHISLSTSLNDIHVGRLRPQSIDRSATLYVEPTIRGGWRAQAKRTFDVSVAVIALVLASPILLIAAAAIKIESRGPVFFVQERIGRRGRPFRIVKLRTMYADAEDRLAELQALNECDGALFKMTDDPRITRVGKFLRRTSIDEIPQFWNVIRNDMSVVGPRPALPSEVAQWDEETSERLRVLPGITGLWQVEGRSDTDFATYKRLDLYYVDNWSLSHDVVIVLKTFKTVLSGHGAV